MCVSLPGQKLIFFRWACMLTSIICNIFGALQRNLTPMLLIGHIKFFMVFLSIKIRLLVWNHTQLCFIHIKFPLEPNGFLSIFSSNHYIHCFVFHRVPQRKLVPGNFLHPVFLVKFKMKQLLRALCFIVKALPRVQRSPPHHTKQCPIISTSPLRSSSDMLVKYVIH